MLFQFYVDFTNDVALLTFVPFTILVLRMAQMEQQMIAVVLIGDDCCESGSMATPVGNPQNLYLYSVSGMSLGEFIKVMGPLSVLSLMLILAGCLAKKNEKLQMQVVPQIKKEKKTGENLLLLGLFLVSLLSVLRFYPGRLCWGLLF